MAGDAGTPRPSGRGRKPLHPLPGTVPAGDAMTRSRGGEPRVTGRLVRPTLSDALFIDLADENAAITLLEARTRVYAEWERQINDGTIKGKTIDGYRHSVDQFVNYTVANSPAGVAHLLNDTGRVHIESWLPVPPSGRDTPIAEATMRTRLFGIKALFITATALRLCGHNPADAIEIPRTYIRYVCPFNDAEITTFKQTARLSLGDGRVAAALALILCGATLREAGFARVCDVDVQRRLLWLHDGGSRTFDRWVSIYDDWCFNALTWQIRHATEDLDPTLAPYKPLVYVPRRDRTGLDPAKEGERRASAITNLIADLFAATDVAQPGKHRPESLREWLANDVFTRTGSIEAAAYQIGMSSLDAMAEVLSVDWKGACAPQPTGSTPPPVMIGGGS